LPQRRKSRIRGLQSHKKSVELASPGSRTAINLTGVSTDELSRGDVVTTPGWLEPSQLIDTHFRLLPDAPKPLRHNQEVEIFSGAAEAMGYARLLGVRQIQPGQEGWVQLRLTKRIPVVKGDRFIIRQPSPPVTIGGGVIVDPLPRRRHRRFRPDLISRLETLMAGTPEDLLLAELDRRGPIPVRALLDDAGVPTATAADALASLLKGEEAFLLSDPARRLTPAQLGNKASAKILVASRAGWAALLSQIKAHLSAHHARFPLRIGMPRGELKSRLKLETRLFNEALKRGQLEGALIATDTSVRLYEHQVRFSPDQQVEIDELLANFRRAPFNTPLPKDVAAAVGDDVLLALTESGRLIRLSSEVILLAETYTDFTEWIEQYLRENEAVTVAQVRDVYQTSRKYALALLEYTDQQRITRRVGDARVLVE
jgi:selenocysteine-specific elongation factor